MNMGTQTPGGRQRPYGTMKSLAAENVFTATGALIGGWQLERPMTEVERECLAVANAEPTNFMTLTSKSMSRAEAVEAWTALRKRINRRKPTKRHPLIYITVPACSTRHDGYHLHVLLWEYLHAESLLLGPARDLGFGSPKIRQITPSPMEWMTAAAYTLGQQRPVFGSGHHRRHQAKEKFARTFSTPSRATLEKHCPELLSGLYLARNRSVSDLELVEHLPIFSHTTHRSNEV